MLNSTNLIVESLSETQLKFKILHSCKLPLHRKKDSLNILQRKIQKIFFTIVYTIMLKKVLTSKINNRIITNYFKKIFVHSRNKEYFYLKKNKHLLELEYLHTLAINNSYELSILEPL